MILLCETPGVRIYVIRSELTCAGLDALGPRVINAVVIGISAVPKPSTAPSTAAAFAGLFESAAHGASRR